VALYFDTDLAFSVPPFPFGGEGRGDGALEFESSKKEIKK